jgi:phospholipid transport system substrate-binding protein
MGMTEMRASEAGRRLGLPFDLFMAQAGRRREACAVPRLRRRQFVGIALLGAAALHKAASAAAPAEIVQPIATLNDAILRAWQADAGRPFTARYEILGPAVARALDLPTILRASVGPRWAGLSASDQTALLTVFERYTVASYVAGFTRYAGQTIEIDPDPRRIGGNWIVETRTLRRDGPGTRIDYVMHLADGEEPVWKASDVLLEGTISRVSVQRSDFRASLSEAGAAGLIAHLRQRTADLSGGTV